jgi:hypothetical protein
MPIKLKSTATTSAQAFKKICIHGQSGVGKTMLAATAHPYIPLIILTEQTGDESLQPANINRVFGAKKSDIWYNVDLIEAYDSDAFEEALKYAIEDKTHNVVIFDSLSKASRLILKAMHKVFADGRKAYGEHNDFALDMVEQLMDGDKHVVFLCGTTRIEDSTTGATMYAPSFEGKGFSEKFVYELPHILYMEDFIEESDGSVYKVLRCHQGATDKRCKNRGGVLNEIEEPHLGRLITKLCGGKHS